MNFLPTRVLLRFILSACLQAAGLAASAQGAEAQAMLQRHEALREQMVGSPFGRPMVVESAPSKGEVWAVIDQPYSVVGPALREKANWCDVLILPFNVKQCTTSADGIALVVGRKTEQAVEDAYRIDFRYASQQSAERLRVQMSADSGPVGTRDYRLVFEAVPLDARRSFVHMSYAYEYGMAAKMATQAYLATAGRNKVGFTVTGRTPQGEPMYVDGLRGIAERNAMRYYLAVEAFLSAPQAAQRDKRLRDWFDATERHAGQLHEMERDEYLALKRGDIQAGR